MVCEDSSNISFLSWGYPKSRIAFYCYLLFNSKKCEITLVP
jgi:hypothetical protein